MKRDTARSEKNKQEARNRARSYYPLLARTTTQAIVQRPSGGRRTRVYFADTMRRILPQFKFNPERDRWEAPLDQLPAAYTALASITSDSYVNLSSGARECLEAHHNGRKPWRARMLEIAAQIEPTHWHSAQLAQRIAYAETPADLKWNEIETLAQAQPDLAQELAGIAEMMARRGETASPASPGDNHD